MLRPRGDHRDAHLDRAKIFRDPREAEVTEPIDVRQRFIDGIHTFFPGGMTAFPPGHAIQHHQSLLRHGHIHSRGLPYHPEVDIPDILEEKVETTLTTDFLLSRG